MVPQEKMIPSAFNELIFPVQVEAQAQSDIIPLCVRWYLRPPSAFLPTSSGNGEREGIGCTSHYNVSLGTIV